MKLLSVLMISLALSCMSGCATVSNSGLRGKDPLKMNVNGIAFMSLGYARLAHLKGGQPFDAYSIYFFPKGKSEPERNFYAIPGNIFSDDKATIKSDQAVVDIAGIELPPGEYEVKSYGAFTDNGMFSRSMKSSKAFSVPFTVKQGEVTYLGSLLLLDLGSSSAYGVVDEFDRDFKKLAQIRPELASVPTSRAVVGSTEKDAVFPVLNKK